MTPDFGEEYTAHLMEPPTSGRFAASVVEAVREGMIVGIRAGRRPHRIIGIWAVVVEGRIFVRSWSLKPRSWWRTFLEDPRGVLEVKGRRLAVRAVQTRSERLKDAVSRAYLEKYSTPASLRYARDLGRPRSRATTTELVPASAARARRGPARPAPGRRSTSPPGGSRSARAGRAPGIR
ncbi:MAG TPA: DUF2255 family protein [Vicinamibacteria bacterium]|nr:DUF2255 family protein [Vicinamibacteria bacterium]